MSCPMSNTRFCFQARSPAEKGFTDLFYCYHEINEKTISGHRCNSLILKHYKA